jgi:hypothetical protein
VLTGDIVLLPKLFERVLTPQAVRDELANREAPAAMRAWIAQAPAWLDVQPNPDAGASDDRCPSSIGASAPLLRWPTRSAPISC